MLGRLSDWHFSMHSAIPRYHHPHPRHHHHHQNQPPFHFDAIYLGGLPALREKRYLAGYTPGELLFTVTALQIYHHHHHQQHHHRLRRPSTCLACYVLRLSLPNKGREKVYLYPRRDASPTVRFLARGKGGGGKTIVFSNGDAAWERIAFVRI
jgi:hypothetical protein